MVIVILLKCMNMKTRWAIRSMTIAIAWALAFTVVQAQVVTTIPPFPTINDEVTIRFDATQGNGALANFSGVVYCHTGLITSESASGSDWKYVQGDWGTADPDVRMTRTGQNFFQITYNIREYYGVPEDEEVLQMAFVFRNEDGSIVGRATDGTDIFVDVFPADAGLFTTLEAPRKQYPIVAPGEGVEVRALASAEATLSLYDDGELLTETTGTTLEYTITNDEVGSNDVLLIADNGVERDSQAFSYLVIGDQQTVLDPPDGTENGINYLSDTSVIVQLYAPNKQRVFLQGSFNGWKPTFDNQMNKSTNGNTYWLQVNGLEPGKWYTFNYLVDDNLRIADPYSTLILDPNHDTFIAEETYPNMPPYPKGRTQGVVTLFRTAEPAFDWQTTDFERPKETDLVIYELLMRDFLEQSDYNTLIDTLDYLERLGVNTIQFMPVNEFEGNDSWGYNPSYHMALDKYYGNTESFKRFIDEAHARGMAVILDVVYNHAFSQSPLVQLYWDAANFRPTPENPWFNVTPRHPFNVGYDFNHESPVTKEFVKRVMQHWIEEFRVDGFRFDLSKGFTQENNPNDVGAWGRYDASRIAILKEYADYIWSLDPGFYVILEHFADNDEEKELADYGMMFWGNLNHEYSEAAMGYTNDLSWGSYRERGWNDPHVITYMESHDEERMMYRCLNFGNNNANYDVKDFNTALERVELASVFFYTIPGPKMLWQFGELGYDLSINRCSDGSIGEGDRCRLTRRPIRWDYLNNPERQRLFAVTAALIDFKLRYDVTETTDFQLNVANDFEKTIHLNHPDFDVTAVGNFNVIPEVIDPNFQQTGWWYEYFTGDSILVNNVNSGLSLQPGEYRLYTSERLNEGGALVTNVEEVSLIADGVNIYPNPVNAPNQAILEFELLEAGEVMLEIFDTGGRRLRVNDLGQRPAGFNQQPVAANLPGGTYWLKISIGTSRQFVKWVVK